jgi:hypothetical protein
LKLHTSTQDQTVRRLDIIIKNGRETTNRIAGVSNLSITGLGRLWDAVGLAGLWDGRIEGPTGVSESGDSMRFLMRFIGERFAEDLEEDSSVVEPTLILVAMEDCIDNLDRLLRRADDDDDELAKEIPVFCQVLDR